MQGRRGDRHQVPDHFGSLKTSSAGLFIVFLSFVIIVFALAPLTRGRPDAASSPKQEPSKFSRTLLVFWALLGTMAGSGVLAAAIGGDAGFGLGLLAGMLAFLLLVWIAVMIAAFD